MHFLPTLLPGVFVVETEAHEDPRGSFARLYCAREFERHGLDPAVAQASLSFNHRAGTLRGLHYQVAPATETKLVRCIAGAIHDVVVDVRPGSPTFGQHVAVELSAGNRRALSIPPLCAHGFQTLTDGAEVLYLISAYHTPGCERGLRYDDPNLSIPWPLPVSTIAEKDTRWPLLAACPELLNRGRLTPTAGAVHGLAGAASVRGSR